VHSHFGLSLLTNFKKQHTACLLDICSNREINMLNFLAARAEITNLPKSKQITFHRGNFITTGFYKPAWLAAI
jgi:hypothetical protein